MEPQLLHPERAFGGTHQLLALIERIYATVQDSSLWPSVMEEIGQAMEGESLAIYATFPGSAVPAIVALREMPQEVWDSFAGYYAGINPIMAAASRRLAPDTTWYSNHAINDADLEHTECYADFYKPNRMHYCAGMLISLPKLSTANLSCQRPKSKGPFGERADIVCQALRPHLQRALELHFQFGSLQAKASGWQAALEAMDHAVFGLDAEGKIVLSNSHAEAIVRLGDVLRLIHGRLFAVKAGSNRLLQYLLTNTVATGAGGGTGSGGSLLLPRDEKPAARLTATPFSAPYTFGRKSVVALVFVSDPSRPAQSRTTAMRSLFGLTAAEAKVAHLLLQGFDTGESADRLGITLETCRLHVKRILSKTGVGRQSELIRLMKALPGSA